MFEAYCKQMSINNKIFFYDTCAFELQGKSASVVDLRKQEFFFLGITSSLFILEQTKIARKETCPFFIIPAKMGYTCPLPESKAQALPGRKSSIVRSPKGISGC